MLQPTLKLRGAKVFQGLLGKDEQHEIVQSLRKVAQAAPFFQPHTATGKKMSVRMTSAGEIGWVADTAGYRYQTLHPQGMPWPQIPECLNQIWRKLGSAERQADSCLINYYGENARMGLHQDKDETCLDWPVVSLSLGDDALFRVGSHSKTGKTESLWLKSGDAAVLEGRARLAFHGIDRIRFQSSPLLKHGGRINITLRVAG